MPVPRDRYDPEGLPKVIDIYQPEQRALWARRLRVSEERLQEAVREVGVELDAVRCYLSQSSIG
jgi:hypothetical protein